MACCNIAWGNVPPSVPPTILQFPIYLDRTHREVWYWNGNYWELVWQLPLASDTTGGVVKISPDSPITIDSDGYLQIDCARLNAHCNFLDKATLDAAIENFRSQFMAEITRIDRRIDAILTTIGTIVVRLTAIEKTVGDFDRRISLIETSVTDLSRRVSIIEGDIVTIKGAVTDINTRITNITNGGNALASEIEALKKKDIALTADIAHIPLIEDPGGPGANPQTGVLTTFPSGFRIRGRNFGVRGATVDAGGGMVIQKWIVSDIIEFASVGANFTIVVTPTIINGGANSGLTSAGPLSAWAEIDVSTLSATLCIHGKAADVAMTTPSWVVFSV